MRLRFQKGDLVAIALCLLIAAAVLGAFLPGRNTDSLWAEIYLDNRLLQVVPLDKAQTFTVEGEYHATVTVSGGKIAVTASDCPGEDCVGCGWVDTPGRSIVCLPGRLEIRILSRDSGVDFVVG